MTQPPIETDLATEIVAVYRAPLEDFISRRDALAKQLRAEKRRDDAALVKALRKPSRIAWALDGVVHEDPVSIEHLAVAIREAQAAPIFRTGLERVREQCALWQQLVRASRSARDTPSSRTHSSAPSRRSSAMKLHSRSFVLGGSSMCRKAAA